MGSWLQTEWQCALFGGVCGGGGRGKSLEVSFFVKPLKKRVWLTQSLIRGDCVLTLKRTPCVYTHFCLFGISKSYCMERTIRFRPRVFVFTLKLSTHLWADVVAQSFGLLTITAKVRVPVIWSMCARFWWL